MRSVGVAVVAVLMVLQTAMQTEAKGICPLYKCGENCVTRYGANGCPNGCDCGPSCQDIQCDPGTVCEYHTVQCFTQPCYPQPTCVDSEVVCAMFICEEGCTTNYGPDGCPSSCDCSPSCQNVPCDTGDVCEMQYIDCHLKKPCNPEPVCVPAPVICPVPKLLCRIRCLYGVQTDENGCPLPCSCKLAPDS